MKIKELLKTSLAFCVLFITQKSFCQSDMQDVIILKNGNKYKGYIIHKDSSDTKILTSGDKVFVINNLDIVYIEKQAPGTISLFNDRRFKPNCFQSQIETMNGYSTYKRALTGIRFINGYKFNSHHFIGLGIGGIIHHGSFTTDLKYDNHKSYPIFMRYSFDIWAKKSSPYLFTDISTHIENPYREKMLKPISLRCGIGNKIILKKNIIYFSLAYSYCKSRYAYQSWSSGGYVTTGYSNWYKAHTAEISFGFQFN